MRTRAELTEKINDGYDKMKAELDDFEREVWGTGPSLRLYSTFVFDILAVVDMQLRLVLLRHLTARSLYQFRMDIGLLTSVVIEYVTGMLMLAILTVIYLLTLVIVRPLEVLLEQLKK
jgi:hypothetical protein